MSEMWWGAIQISVLRGVQKERLPVEESAMGTQAAGQGGRMTVRSMVGDIQKEMLAGNLSPDDTARLLSMATALLSNCLEEIREAEMVYNRVKAVHYGREKSANRAEIQAQTTTEYWRVREAQDMHKVLEEDVRSLRKMCDIQVSEMRFTPR